MESIFIYKREVNKSVLWDGFGIDRTVVVFFIGSQGLLRRGEKKDVTLLLNGKSYQAVLKNLNNPVDKRINDSYQIRYPANGELAQALQNTFYRTYQSIVKQYAIWKNNGTTKRFHAYIPEEYKEYMAISTTHEPNVFLCEPILVDDMSLLKNFARERTERSLEELIDSEQKDDDAGIIIKPGMIRVRHLNKKIGDSLKIHYQYRCQICGQIFGEKYGSHLAETHHIDYFSKSFNNDIRNLLVVCPNHHGVIHDMNPVFNRSKCTYLYPNGFEEGLQLNDHLLMSD